MSAGSLKRMSPPTKRQSSKPSLHYEKRKAWRPFGFLLGADPAQISRHLKGIRSTTLTNYLRIARALGYRCKIVLEKAGATPASKDILSDLKITPHKVLNV